MVWEYSEALGDWPLLQIHSKTKESLSGQSLMCRRYWLDTYRIAAVCLCSTCSTFDLEAKQRARSSLFGTPVVWKAINANRRSKGLGAHLLLVSMLTEFGSMVWPRMTLEKFAMARTRATMECILYVGGTMSRGIGKV